MKYEIGFWLLIAIMVLLTISSDIFKAVLGVIGLCILLFIYVLYKKQLQKKEKSL